MSNRRFAGSARAAFTVLEMMVAAAVLALILSMLLGVISQTSSVTQSATQKISAFQGARTAFDIIARNLGQATLNSYWDYDAYPPTRYLRKSELHFLIGRSGVSPFPGTGGTGQAIFFQAPVGVTGAPATYGGLETLLNAMGYYVEYGLQEKLPPPFTSTTDIYRYRLMQAIQPTEDLKVYDNTTGSAWVANVAAAGSPIANNVICLIAWPRRSPEDDPGGLLLSSSFGYDSRDQATSSSQPATANQLPPAVQLTIVAMDETSAARFCVSSSAPGEISSALNGLFENAASYQADLDSLETRLAASKINFRTFSTTVAIRESKME